MMDSDEFFIVCKFTSGEQVMAVLRSEDEQHVELEYPMSIRTIPNFDTHREQITAHPFCQFSDDKSFVIDKKNVLYIKKLHHVFVPHYRRIVEEHEQTTFTASKQEPTRAEDLNWDEEEVLLSNADNAKKAVAMLKQIFGESSDEREEEKPIINFVKGNDTLN
jgi:hypothetical protein